MSQITTQRDGAVLIATIANPPHGYMDAETESELEKVLDEVDTDAAVRAVVLTSRIALPCLPAPYRDNAQGLRRGDQRYRHGWRLRACTGL